MSHETPALEEVCAELLRLSEESPHFDRAEVADWTIAKNVLGSSGSSELLPEGQQVAFVIGGSMGTRSMIEVLAVGTKEEDTATEVATTALRVIQKNWGNQEYFAGLYASWYVADSEAHRAAGVPSFGAVRAVGKDERDEAERERLAGEGHIVTDGNLVLTPTMRGAAGFLRKFLTAADAAGFDVLSCYTECSEHDDEYGTGGEVQLILDIGPGDKHYTRRAVSLTVYIDEEGDVEAANIGENGRDTVPVSFSELRSVEAAILYRLGEVQKEIKS